MVDARAIADMRLAKGEITSDEHAAIIAALTPSDSELIQTVLPNPTVMDGRPSGISKNDAFWWIAIPVGLFFGLLRVAPSESHSLNPMGWIFIFALFLAFIFGVIKAAFGR